MTRLSHNAALALADETDLTKLMEDAARLRDLGNGETISYSRKVFLPLTHLCRDRCGYCTFAETPSGPAYLSLEEMLTVARRGADAGCKEALFTLGDRPESRYAEARSALKMLGYTSTLDYLRRAAELIWKETGLLPHLNPGLMNANELAMLRPVSASMGLMLETTAERLGEKSGPHYACPDKIPERRLETIRLAGEAKIPFTSGILIGIGETRRERIESLLALRDLHERYSHIQEVIVQNFRAKPDTKMASAPEPVTDDLLWTLAVARLVLGAEMNLQAPPNLNPGQLSRIVAAGINDWGGVSPITPDFVNPEAPWPHLDQLVDETARAGKTLIERLCVYPKFVGDPWIDESMRPSVRRMSDSEGFARDSDWAAGAERPPPISVSRRVSTKLNSTLSRAASGVDLTEEEIVALFSARGSAFDDVCVAADNLRARAVGDSVSYVVTRNINYTNVCYFKCRFCAFSQGKLSENLRGAPYHLPLEEISRRVNEAWARGATEVCLQGGIHPDYTGQTYLDICQAIKRAQPNIHIHAFSPLEIWQGAHTLGLGVREFLARLEAAGLGSLPGTAAEILDDEIRAQICPDKISTEEWLSVMETAHQLGLRTTSTIMFGHVDGPRNSARHLLRLRALQARTRGFTELVPLPFVHMESPLYLRGGARQGPTFREAVLMHAIARLALHPHLTNIQTSWVKMGKAGAIACLSAGANDLGGTLMNESITRAAGASHGEELSPLELQSLIRQAGRTPRQRTTTYDSPTSERLATGMAAGPLTALINKPAKAFLRFEGV